jgi:hypothetical protein
VSSEGAECCILHDFVRLGGRLVVCSDGADMFVLIRTVWRGLTVVERRCLAMSACRSHWSCCGKVVVTSAALLVWR